LSQHKSKRRVDTPQLRTRALGVASAAILQRADSAAALIAELAVSEAARADGIDLTEYAFAGDAKVWVNRKDFAARQAASSTVAGA
jgi:hypothetical protein